MARATSWDSDTESDSDTVPFHLGDILTQAAGRRFRPAGAGCWLLVASPGTGCWGWGWGWSWAGAPAPGTSNQQPATSNQLTRSISPLRTPVLPDANPIGCANPG